MGIEEKLINLFNALYKAAPKDHNRFNFETEFQSRVKASLNVKDMKKFIAKLCRKLGIKLADLSVDEEVVNFSEEESKQALQLLREELEYILIKAKIERSKQ